jgi:hypothetical protein
MRFKLGLIVGSSVGYYLGAKAGRQRYDQINRTIRRVRHTDAVEAVTDKAKSTVGDGLGKARDLVGSRVGSHLGGGGGNGHAPG